MLLLKVNVINKFSNLIFKKYLDIENVYIFCYLYSHSSKDLYLFSLYIYSLYLKMYFLSVKRIGNIVAIYRSHDLGDSYRIWVTRFHLSLDPSGQLRHHVILGPPCLFFCGKRSEWLRVPKATHRRVGRSRTFGNKMGIP